MNTEPARILVVDDEESILQFVSYNLRKEGYEVTVAADGDAALELAESQAFDLIVLDIMLPGTDGYEVCRRLRAKGDTPVLFLSARDTELDKVVGLEIGGDDYLAKPFGVRELIARVKALLRRSGTRTAEPARDDASDADSDALADKTRLGECSICMDAAADARIPACGHSLCVACAVQLVAAYVERPTCPFCRCDIEALEAAEGPGADAAGALPGDGAAVLSKHCGPSTVEDDVAVVLPPV